MEKIPYSGKDNETKSMADFISQRALGNIIITDQQPTADTLKVNSIIFYNDELYLKLPNGNSYKFALTAI